MQEKEDETVRFGLWIRIPDIPLTTDVMSIGKLLHLSEPPCPHLQSDTAKDSYFPGLRNSCEIVPGT